MWSGSKGPRSYGSEILVSLNSRLESHAEEEDKKIKRLPSRGARELGKLREEEVRELLELLPPGHLHRLCLLVHSRLDSGCGWRAVGGR